LPKYAVQIPINFGKISDDVGGINYSLFGTLIGTSAEDAASCLFEKIVGVFAFRHYLSRKGVRLVD
jgi:hypothetical protein